MSRCCEDSPSPIISCGSLLLSRQQTNPYRIQCLETIIKPLRKEEESRVAKKLSSMSVADFQNGWLESHHY